MARRGHPYFSQINRRTAALIPGPRRANTRTPLVKPKDEPGVLWDAFRDKHPSG